MAGFSRGTIALIVTLGLPFSAAPAVADSEHVLYAFEKKPSTDGFRPSGALVADDDGNLYGATIGGGASGIGTVFKIALTGEETILHNFAGGADGNQPIAGLMRDAAGNLYGTTVHGGDHDCGTVFRITPNGTESVLYAFKGGSDGCAPEAELIQDQSGTLYSATATGGAHNFGTVFKLAPDGTETVLYSFKGGNKDGATPEAGLWSDADGNLYGTTFQGAPSNAGIVFKLSPNGTETVLHLFTDGVDGGGPSATLVPDGKGNLYGTAAYGGNLDCLSGIGCGVVFKIAKDDSMSVLYSFPSPDVGRAPMSRLLVSKGKRKVLYGTASFGGSPNYGVVFKLTLKGKETVLHRFTSRNDGYPPSGPLTANADFTQLFGTTLEGGNKSGVVYVLRP